MASNFDTITYLSNQKLDQIDTVPTETGELEVSMRQLQELNDTVKVQRRIIAEQAVKVKELQDKLKKYGWSM